MKKLFVNILLMVAFSISLSVNLASAQEDDTSSESKRKAGKNSENEMLYSRVDSLLKLKMFVFQETDMGSDVVYIIVDSAFAEIQNGIRNNLEGKIISYQVKKDDKRHTQSVSIKMKGYMSTADIVIFIGPGGTGNASINSDFPGRFSFYGKLVDFEDSAVYQGGSHLVH